MERGRSVRPDLRHPGRRKHGHPYGDDRRHPSQGPQDGGEPAQKGAVPRRIRRTKGGLNSKLHAACDADGKPLILLLTEGQVSDYRGADTMLPAFPDADDLIADRGYDSDRFRQALLDLGIEPCIPGRSNREEEILYDKALYKQRNLIERMFGRLKDWRRIATRYDRCAHTFMSAICIAATVIFWL
ncbi:putative transposase [Magnetospira sp. QH-2]|nr:putative transposase [Magnetospira sp. QH-2]